MPSPVTREFVFDHNGQECRAWRDTASHGSLSGGEAPLMKVGFWMIDRGHGPEPTTIGAELNPAEARVALVEWLVSRPR